MKDKKPSAHGRIVIEAMTVVVEILLKDHKRKTEIMSAIGDVQLGARRSAQPLSLCQIVSQREKGWRPQPYRIGWNCEVGLRTF